jgi:hypothetical protein
MALLMQAWDGQPDSAIIPKFVALPAQCIAFAARRSAAGLANCMRGWRRNHQIESN